LKNCVEDQSLGGGRENPDLPNFTHLPVGNRRLLELAVGRKSTQEKSL
jgi:hypothetical protein